jgi:predicted nucleic acid-binding protein
VGPLRPLGEGLVLIDTSLWIAAMGPGGDQDARETVRELVVAGRAATCEMVIAEVLRGAESDAEAEAMEAELAALHVLPCEGAGSVVAAMGRRTGAPRQRLADLFIAAVAWRHKAALLHRDRHLSQIAARFGIDEVAP